MKQYSLNGESIEIASVSGKFLLIDPLYLQELKEDDQNWDLKSRQDLIELEKNYFPYGGTLLGYLESKNDNQLRVDISKIKYWNRFNEPEELNRAEEKLAPVFATDSGIILIADFVNLHKILLTVDYNGLVEALDQLDSYVERVTQSLKNKGFGLIAAPGIGQGYDFEGSGTFKLEK